jgi:hypothetical protein
MVVCRQVFLAFYALPSSCPNLGSLIPLYGELARGSELTFDTAVYSKALEAQEIGLL